MDGLSRAIGAGAPVTLGGKTYKASPLSLEDLGFLENAILLARGNPVDDVLKASRGSSDSARAEMVKRAMRDMKKDRFSRIVKVDEFDEFLATPAGVELSLWLCLRQSHRSIEFLEDARDLLSRCSEDELVEFVRIRNRISGLDFFASMDWPDPLDNIRPEVAERRRKEAATKYRLAPWRLNFRKLKEAFVGERDMRCLTFYQWRVLTTDESELGGISQVDVEDIGKTRLAKPVIVIGNDGKGLKELENARQKGKKK